MRRGNSKDYDRTRSWNVKIASQTSARELKTSLERSLPGERTLFFDEVQVFLDAYLGSKAFPFWKRVRADQCHAERGCQDNSDGLHICSGSVSARKAIPLMGRFPSSLLSREKFILCSEKHLAAPIPRLSVETEIVYRAY